VNSLKRLTAKSDAGLSAVLAAIHDRACKGEL
jgi:hypothetical protein